MKKHSMAVRIVFLLAWVLGILLPLYSFRRLSPTYRAAFGWVFHTHASHVLMHTFLYAVLAYLLASFIPRSVCRTRQMFFCVLAGVAVIAASQEAIQMMSEQVHLGSDEIFDFFVDLNGGMLGALLFLKCSRHKSNTDRRSNKTHRQLQLNCVDAVDVSVMRDVRQA
jgi:FlaA1/EpsC-like NDP-sugar epimerase